MIKKYVQVLVLIFWICSTTFSFSQIIEVNSQKNNAIEGLIIYPNPVSNGKLYITTSKNLSKHIEIFDILGKKLYHTQLVGSALDISRLNTGVYIIKITENNTTVTRKLVVK
jgi:hypothetical protein